MKIQYFSLHNLGRFKNLDNVSLAPIDNSNVTIFIGNNGAGKTSILKSLATSLSWFVARLRSEKGNGIPIPEDVILSGAASGSIDISVSDNLDNRDTSLEWTLAKTKTGKKGQLTSQLNDVSKLADYYRTSLTKDEKFSVPLIAFYSVERAVIDIPFKIRGKHNFSQIDGYDNSLKQGVDFRRFFEWFREREDLENELSTPSALEGLFKQNPSKILDVLNDIEGANERLDNIKEFDFKALTQEVKKISEAFNFIKNIEIASKDRQLNSVRTAITNFMPGFSNLKVRRKPRLHMSIDKEGKTFNVLQLSQGEKSLMALVGDIARRLAIMNPKMENPLYGDGIVLIDEVDMHLHPTWQRDIVGRLSTTFPQCQFILTTHSPLVISDCKNVRVYSLDDGEITTVPSQYGQDANTVLLDVMDTHIRNARVAEKLNDLLDLIQNNNISEAKSLLSGLEKELSSSNLELIKARLILRKMELKDAKNS